MRGSLETAVYESQRTGRRGGLRDGAFEASARGLGLSRLSVGWLALGIDLDRIDPGCPSQNGGHERMHRDLAWELERPNRGNLRPQAAAMETWRCSFNEERPHEALGMRCPAEVYTKSPHRGQGTPDELDYPAGYLQRKVQATGVIKIEGLKIVLSSTLAGWNVGLKPGEPNRFSVHFARLCLGEIDLTTESFSPHPWKARP